MVVGEIDTKDISVVVQGAVDIINTHKCLQSIRENFPLSEIVLSTWVDSFVSECDYDVLVFNKDPGSLAINASFGNLNRQIVSTLNGIKKSSRKYVLKLRSDMTLDSCSFLHFWNKYPKRNPKYFWLEHKVIIPTLYCKQFLDIGSQIPTPFHYSDWMHFGLRSDLLKIWNIPLAQKKIYSNYFRSKESFTIKLDGRWLECMLPPESYIFSTAVKKYIPYMDYQSLDDYCTKYIELSEQILVNNFIVIEPTDLGISMKKPPYESLLQDLEEFRKKQPGCLLTNKIFDDLYTRLL